MYKRLALFTYGVAGYLLFMGAAAYTIVFLGGLGVAGSVDHPVQLPPAAAAALNAVLLGVLGGVHLALGRPAVRRRLSRYLPGAAWRSTRVLAAGLSLVALVHLWAPMGGVVWAAEGPFLGSALEALFAAGWALVLGATFQVSHWDVFGLRQVWHHLRGRPCIALDAVPDLHAGWLLALWATPVMTTGHLLLAGAVTGTLLAGAWLEARDLIRAGAPGTAPCAPGHRQAARPLAAAR